MIEEVMPLVTCETCPYGPEPTSFCTYEKCHEAQRLSDLRAMREWLGTRRGWVDISAIQELDQLIKEAEDIPPEQPHAACGED